jgi:hypothetical protein
MRSFMLQEKLQPSRGICSSSQHEKMLPFLDANSTFLDPDQNMKYVAESKVTIRLNPNAKEYGMQIYVC